MAREITLATQTMFAELREQCLDASFDANFDERGTFIKKRLKRDDYWYFQRWQDGKPVQKYVGPARDPDVAKRVETFQNRLKPSFSHRREMVRALLAAGLPRPLPPTGPIVEALWKSGFFRLRGVLIGTTAYQCYSGLLRVRLEASATTTADADFAQYLAISREVGDSMPAMEDVLKSVDPTFTAVMDPIDGRHVVGYRNRDGYKVEFLTPKQGASHREGRPVKMPALGGVSATPLSYLDFLIADPIKSVMLHGAGVPVTVPAPERYAVHKLIVAVQRGAQNVKSAKDVQQASALIGALVSQGQAIELIGAWKEAWSRGPKWRDALRRGRSMLPRAGFEQLALAASMAHAQFEGEGEAISLEEIGFDLPKQL